MLWDLIRDFFVTHIFGGYDSVGNTYGGVVGFFDGDLWYSNELGTNAQNVFADDNISGQFYLGDYLSTIATIISITIIVVLCCLFIKKIVGLVGGLIRQ
jgi:hypothetical protein